MIEFTSKAIEGFVYLNYEGYQDVMYEARYEIKGVKSGYEKTSGSSFLLDVSDLSNFIPFDQLTQSIVAGWVEEQHPERVAELKQMIEDDIDEALNPNRVNKQLPE